MSGSGTFFPGGVPTLSKGWKNEWGMSFLVFYISTRAFTKSRVTGVWKNIDLEYLC